jgi:hypothetical protein
VPDDDEDGPAHGAAGLLPPAPPGREARRRKRSPRTCPCSPRRRQQDGDPLGVGVAVSLLPAALAGPGLPGGRGEPGPGHQRLRRREAAQVQAYLGDQRGGGLPAKARDLIQPVRSWQRGGIAGPPAAGPVTPSASTPQDAGIAARPASDRSAPTRAPGAVTYERQLDSPVAASVDGRLCRLPASTSSVRAHRA